MRLFHGSLRSALAASGLLFIMSAASAAPPEAAVLPSPAAAPAAASFQQHYEAAVQLYLSERYPEALKEFEAAYAVRQLPRLLINIGTTHRKLGEAKAALSAYEAYLRIEPNPDPEVKKKLDEALSQVHSMLNVAAAPAAAGKDAKGGKDDRAGSSGRGGKRAHAGTLKPSFTVVDLGIERLKPQATNKPVFGSVTGTSAEDVWAGGTYGTLIHLKVRSGSHTR
ncbi:MAG TPA: hypothetical protein PLW65_29350 [Pseudomonadota bacterium]|nr:hypothetical protein [Pseudomonadota bacterium]